MSLNTLINNGPSDNRVDIIFMGDGYTQDEIDSSYLDHINGFVKYLFSDNALTAPFHQYQQYFNVHYINVVSAESGVDNPSGDITRDTALDARYRWDGVTDRLLYASASKANNILTDAIEDTDIGAEMRLITTNSDKYGGGGGYFAVYAGGNSSAYEVALHEIGHSFAGLADEYSTGGPSTYTRREPNAPNSTIDPTGSEWSHWLGYQDPILGEVGVYEGSSYSKFGVYRPTGSSKMRALNKPFDAIAKEAFVLKFYNLIDPLDHWSGKCGSMNLSDALSLSVIAVDTSVVQIAWSINGQTVGGNFETLNLRRQDLDVGTYEVTVRVADNTGLVRRDLEQVQQDLTWTLDITQSTTQLTGTQGDDTLFATAGKDTIRGYVGDDVFVSDGGIGSDLFIGSAGNDTVDYSRADSAVTVLLSEELAHGKDGTDVLLSIENVIGSSGHDQLIGDGADNLLDGGMGADDLDGGHGADMILGGIGTDSLRGSQGDDSLHGGAGADLIIGGEGNDHLFGDGRADELRGGDGEDELFGGDGFDALHGGDHDDILRGDAGGDALFGGAGSDILIGGRGSDSLTGGTGDGVDDGARDTFVFSSTAMGGGGIDRIRDFADGSDVIDLQAFEFGDFTVDVLSRSGDSIAGLRIDFGNGDVLFVENLMKSQFDAGDVLL